LTHAQVQAQLEYPVYVNEHLFAAAAEGDGWYRLKPAVLLQPPRA
jgi:hypothetical protein